MSDNYYDKNNDYNSWAYQERHNAQSQARSGVWFSGDPEFRADYQQEKHRVAGLQTWFGGGSASNGASGSTSSRSGWFSPSAPPSGAGVGSFPSGGIGGLDADFEGFFGNLLKCVGGAFCLYLAYSLNNGFGILIGLLGFGLFLQGGIGLIFDLIRLALGIIRFAIGAFCAVFVLALIGAALDKSGTSSRSVPATLPAVEIPHADAAVPEHLESMGIVDGAKYATVDTENLNLRSCSIPDDRKCPSMAWLPWGQRVKILGAGDRGWFNVEVQSESGAMRRGYVNGNRLRF